jgi:hypothetical protein
MGSGRSWSVGKEGSTVKKLLVVLALLALLTGGMVGCSKTDTKSTVTTTRST